MFIFNYGSIHFYYLNSLIHAAWSEIQFAVHHVFMSQKLKSLKEEESQPFGPSCAADSLYQYWCIGSMNLVHSFWMKFEITRPLKTWEGAFSAVQWLS